MSTMTATFSCEHCDNSAQVLDNEPTPICCNGFMDLTTYEIQDDEDNMRDYNMTFQTCQFLADLMQTEADSAMQNCDDQAVVDLAASCESQVMDVFRSGLADGLADTENVCVKLSGDQLGYVADSVAWRMEVAFGVYEQDDPMYDEEREALRELNAALRLDLLDE